MHPVGGQIAAGIDGRGDGGVSGKTEILQPTRRHPATTCEQPRPDHATGIEVIAFVPSVVRHFMAMMGIDEGVEHGSQLHPRIEWRFLGGRVDGLGIQSVGHGRLPYLTTRQICGDVKGRHDTAVRRSYRYRDRRSVRNGSRHSAAALVRGGGRCGHRRQRRRCRRRRH